MNIMVTGGAGYIGSHAVKRLLQSGHNIVVVDDLSHGHKLAIDPRAKFIQIDIENTEKLIQIFSEHHIEAVMHFAAFIEVGESVENPQKYYHNNFVKGLCLLKAMQKAQVKKIVFSSTAAVYGTPSQVPIPENHSLNPINPYGRSKLMMEFAIEDFSKAYGLGYVILRYFNVAGATPDGSIGEAHVPESHLIPRILQAATGEAPTAYIFGTDYNTRDGTCIRDYVHVEDLVDAHEKALMKIRSSEGAVFNLGSEQGYSVKEVIAACKEVTDKNFNIEYKPKRAGDAPVLVASNLRAKKELGWEPRYASLKEIIQHAWNWQQKGLPNFLKNKKD